MENKYKPYVSAATVMPELTFRAVFAGIFMAVILGGSNAYLGLKVGMTVAATFPAAVVAIIVMRAFGGSILEENILRATASTGEALVAGAIFTVPAFIIAGTWDTLWSLKAYIEGTIMLLIGGILGTLFVIALRRSMMEDPELPFPESVACAEVVKAGQKGATGGKFILITLILGMVNEFLKNSYAFQSFSSSRPVQFLLAPIKKTIGGIEQTFQGGFFFGLPDASPAVMSVGYIIGPRLACITFSGAVFGHLFLLPLLISMYGGVVGADTIGTISKGIYNEMIKPFAIGAMLTGAIFTIYSMKGNIAKGFRLAFPKKEDLAQIKSTTRLEIDLNLKGVYISILLMTIVMIIFYYYLTGSIGGSILAGIVMSISGFLFAGVAAYLVGLIGSSSNPISGLTLATLIVASALILLIGVKGTQGIAAALGVACVVCCACGISGDMMQDFKIGHLLGGSPRSMAIAELIGTFCVAFVLMIPIALLAKAYTLGSEMLPAPQANLMALVSKGILEGTMPWTFFIGGIFFALALILLKAPSVTLIAVGMYLPFPTTSAIFVGGIIKWILSICFKGKNLSEEVKEWRSNIGILLASGFIAGETLTGIFIAILVVSGVSVITLPSGETVGRFVLGTAWWPALIVFAIYALIMILVPLMVKKENN